MSQKTTIKKIFTKKLKINKITTTKTMQFPKIYQMEKWWTIWISKLKINRITIVIWNLSKFYSKIVLIHLVMDIKEKIWETSPIYHNRTNIPQKITACNMVIKLPHIQQLNSNKWWVRWWETWCVQIQRKCNCRWWWKYLMNLKALLSFSTKAKWIC